MLSPPMTSRPRTYTAARSRQPNHPGCPVPRSTARSTCTQSSPRPANRPCDPGPAQPQNGIMPPSPTRNLPPEPAAAPSPATIQAPGPGPGLPAASRPAREQVTGVRYRLEVRLTPADVGQRVVIRWRRPSPGDGEQIADVLGILEGNDSTSFAVHTCDGALVVIPAARALAGKVVPPAPQNRRRAGPAPP